MLKNRLEEMLESRRGSGCPMGDFIASLDTETADSFRRVMASTIGAQRLFEVMREEGYKISRPSIERARGCFRGEKECKCGAVDGSSK